MGGKIGRQYPDGGAVELLSDAVELLLKKRSLFSCRQLLSCPLEPTRFLELDTQWVIQTLAQKTDSMTPCFDHIRPSWQCFTYSKDPH